MQSFDNNGFIDFDYEDLAYHSDLDIDSGYQEPQEVLANAAAAAAVAAAAAASAASNSSATAYSSVSAATLARGSPRPHVSSPTRIERPNLAPLNLYPTAASSVGGARLHHSVGPAMAAGTSNVGMSGNKRTLGRNAAATLSRRISGGFSGDSSAQSGGPSNI